MDAQAEIEDKLRLERETIARASETCERNQQSLQDIANDGIVSRFQPQACREAWDGTDVLM